MLHIQLDVWNWGMGHCAFGYCPNFTGTLAVCVSGYGLGDVGGGLVDNYSRVGGGNTG